MTVLYWKLGGYIIQYEFFLFMSTIFHEVNFRMIEIINSKPWEWLFSGAGVTVIVSLIYFFKSKRNKKNNIIVPQAKAAPKILVIDDHANPIVKLLRTEGYDVDEDNGSLSNLRNLENGHYDLILLDFDGVGVEFSKKQGIGVLEHIKTKNPKQKILAYSNKNWGLDYQEFIQLADGVLGKAAGYGEYKRKIDELLGA